MTLLLSLRLFIYPILNFQKRLKTKLNEFNLKVNTVLSTLAFSALDFYLYGQQETQKFIHTVIVFIFV